MIHQIWMRGKTVRGSSHFYRNTNTVRQPVQIHIHVQVNHSAFTHTHIMNQLTYPFVRRTNNAIY